MGELLHDLWKVLDETERWHLSDHRWSYVDVLLERVAAALTAGSDRALREVVEDLELIGPDRTPLSADSGPAGNQPPRIRDRVQQIKDRIDPPRTAAKGEAKGGSGR